MIRDYSIVCCLSLLAVSTLIADEPPCRLVAPEAGSSRVISESMELSMDTEVTVAGNVQHVTQAQSTSRKREEHVQAIGEDGLPSKLKVTYHEATQTQEGGQAGLSGNAPVHGKTYRVTRQDGEIAVATRDGMQVTVDGERAYVARDYADLATDRMAAFFDRQTFERGRAVEVPKELAVRLFRTGSAQLEVDELSFAFADTREIDGERHAVFDTRVVMKGKVTPQSSMKVELSGETVVSAGCWPVEMELDGEVDFRGTQTVPGGRDQSEQQMEMVGSGDLTFRMQTDYDD